MIGDSSPATTASIVSSRRLRPATTSPCWMSAGPARGGARPRGRRLERLSDGEGLRLQSPAASRCPSRSCCSATATAGSLARRSRGPRRAVGPRGPCVRLSALASKQERQRQPERTASGACAVARLDMNAIQAIEDLLKVEPRPVRFAAVARRSKSSTSSGVDLIRTWRSA